MKNKKKGFTIVELILTLAITVTILSVVYTIFIQSTKIFSNVNVKSTLQTEAQNAGEKISNAGMQAVKIDKVILESGTIDFTPDHEVAYNILSDLKDINGKDLDASATDDKKYLVIKEIKIMAKEEIPKVNPSDPTTTKDVYYTITHVPTSDPDDKTKARGKLMIKKEGGSDQVIGENVENVTIKPNSTSSKLSQADSIQFNINLAKKKGFSDIKYSIPINVVFRNK